MGNNQKDNFIEMRNKILVLLFSCSLSFSQPSLIWVREYDSGFNDYAQAVATDANGDIIVTGASYNGTNFDCFTIKYNPLGDTLWTRRFDTGASDVAKDVAIDSVGNIVIAGSSCVDSVHDYLLLKYDSSGNLIWARRYQTGLDNFSTGVAVDAFQNIIITGYGFNGNDYDYLTIKYSPFGDTIWCRRFDRGVNDIGMDVSIDPNNNIIVTGSSCDTLTALFLAFTIKYSENGDTIWTRRFIYPAPGTPTYAYGVVADNDSNIIMACVSLFGAPQDIRLIKYASSGDTIWTLRFDQGWYIYFFRPRDITVDTANNIFVTGESKRDLYWSYNFQTYKFSPEGDSLWIVDYQFGLNDPDEFGYGVAVDLMGNIYVTGYYDNGNNYDYLTLKYNESGFIAEANKFENLQPQELIVYPNPFQNHCVIRYALSSEDYASEGIATIKIFDTYGCLIKSFSPTTNYSLPNTLVWFGDDNSGQRVASGVYFIHLETSDRKILWKGKVVKLK